MDLFPNALSPEKFIREQAPLDDGGGKYVK